MKATRPDPELTPGRVGRFWAKVDRRSDDECWPWKSDFHTAGYGLYREWSGKTQTLRITAHRMSMLIAGRDIAGLVVRHDCDNPPCVNPNHLRTGTQAQNVQDAVGRARLNTSGLAIGQSGLWPPRPCRRCGTTVSKGRMRYCAECRAVVTKEIAARRRARMRAGTTPNDRQKMARKRA